MISPHVLGAERTRQAQHRCTPPCWPPLCADVQTHVHHSTGQGSSSLPVVMGRGARLERPRTLRGRKRPELFAYVPYGICCDGRTAACSGVSVAAAVARGTKCTHAMESPPGLPPFCGGSPGGDFALCGLAPRAPGFVRNRGPIFALVGRARSRIIWSRKRSWVFMYVIYTYLGHMNRL